jgi:very-short-patch-repair endonuclease
MGEKKSSGRDAVERGEVYIALLKEKSDFAILQEQGWYRIPVESLPKDFDDKTKWLAFYQPKCFGEDAYRVRYYGRIKDKQIVERRQLFPTEIPNSKSERNYYRITLEKLEERPKPIISLRPRRLLFIPTNWRKFCRAEEINDIFDDSPLEDHLWEQLKNLKMSAERQWMLQIKNSRYYLDFAVFCCEGCIDIEVDGDTWHGQRDRIARDNRRNNDLATIGWYVLRFNGEQILRHFQDDCVGKILETVNKLKGIFDEGLVPRIFYQSSQGLAQQLSLFETASEYHFSTGAEYNLELE